MSIWSDISPAVFIATGAILTMGANTVQGRQAARRDEDRDYRTAMLVARATRADRLRTAYAATVVFAERIKSSLIERRIVWEGETVETRDLRIATEFQRLREQYNVHAPFMMLDADARPIGLLMASMFRNELMLRTMARGVEGQGAPLDEIQALTQSIEDGFSAIERACQEHLLELDLGLMREVPRQMAPRIPATKSRTD